VRRAIDLAGGPEAARDAIDMLGLEINPAPELPTDLHKMPAGELHNFMAYWVAAKHAADSEAEQIAQLPPVMDALRGTAPAASIRLSDCLERWISATHPARNTEGRYRVVFRRLFEVVGDIDLSSLRRPMVRDFIATIAKLPQTNTLPPAERKMSVPALLRFAALNPDTKRIIPATVTTYLIALSAMLTWAKAEDIITENVAEGIAPPVDPRPADDRHLSAIPWREAPSAFAKLRERSTPKPLRPSDS
jgi:hypothetical protein